jgi:hypothetical protein
MTIENLIAELTLALDRNTAALLAVSTLKPSKATKAKADEPALPAAMPATAIAAQAPASVALPAQPPAAAALPSGPDPKTVADAVIQLANEHSREAAVSILAKRKVTRVSDLKPEDYEAVWLEANLAIVTAVANKSNESLV